MDILWLSGARNRACRLYKYLIVLYNTSKLESQKEIIPRFREGLQN
jgi:hypothetical protein